MTDTIDTKIKELFTVLSLQKIEVERLESEIKKSWTTNCSFIMNDSRYNIQTTNINTIVHLLAYLLSMAEYQRKASDMLGLEFIDDYNGFSFDDWVSDFKKRIAIIVIKERKAKINELETRLNSIVSPEQRRLMELEEITKQLQ